jgi:hypothetical protein
VITQENAEFHITNVKETINTRRLPVSLASSTSLHNDNLATAHDARLWVLYRASERCVGVDIAVASVAVFFRILVLLDLGQFILVGLVVRVRSKDLGAVAILDVRLERLTRESVNRRTSLEF